MASPYLDRPRRTLAQAGADMRLDAMQIAALPYSTEEVIGERLEERNCRRCGHPKWPSITRLCIRCRLAVG